MASRQRHRHCRGNHASGGSLVPNINQTSGFRSGSARMTGKVSSSPSEQTGTLPDQFSIVVQRARAVLAKSENNLIPGAASNTASNTNVLALDKTIGDLADLVEQTSDPVWKETYRVALTRMLVASERAKAGTRVPNDSGSISKAFGPPDTFNHPAVGIVPGLEVSSYSARQAGYQQRFNPPPPPLPLPSLPLDPLANTSENNNLDVPGQGTRMPTHQNPRGIFLGPRKAKKLGHSW